MMDLGRIIMLYIEGNLQNPRKLALSLSVRLGFMNTYYLTAENIALLKNTYSDILLLCIYPRFLSLLCNFINSCLLNVVGLVAYSVLFFK